MFSEGDFVCIIKHPSSDVNNSVKTGDLCVISQIIGASIYISDGRFNILAYPDDLKLLFKGNDFRLSYFETELNIAFLESDQYKKAFLRFYNQRKHA